MRCGNVDVHLFLGEQLVAEAIDLGYPWLAWRSASLWLFCLFESAYFNDLLLFILRFTNIAI